MSVVNWKYDKNLSLSNLEITVSSKKIKRPLFKNIFRNKIFIISTPAFYYLIHLTSFCQHSSIESSIIHEKIRDPSGSYGLSLDLSTGFQTFNHEPYLYGFEHMFWITVLKIRPFMKSMMPCQASLGIWGKTAPQHHTTSTIFSDTD